MTRVPSLLHSDSDDFDALYIQEWQGAVRTCQQVLEPDDLYQVGLITDFNMAYDEIQGLQSKTTHEPSSQALGMLFPSLAHLQTFTTDFERSFDLRINSSAFWGMVTLTVRIASQADGALHRIARMFKVIGHKTELFNGYRENAMQANQMKQVKEAALDALVELLAFLRELVKFFRGPAFESSEDDSWRSVTQTYNNSMKGVDEAFDRIFRLSSITKTESRVEEITKLQNLLSLTGETFREEAKLPCVILPAVRHTKFWDRDEIIAQINARFNSPGPSSAEPKAIALYGLGGVGKSHVAMKYAHSKVQELDAIMWVYSQTATALAQSFTDIAMRLELADANAQHHEKNRILVINWLQRTHAKWLLVFDNAESAELLLQYWPYAAQGTVLVTTRDHTLAFQPVGAGIDVPHFDKVAGSGLLLHLLSMDVASDISQMETQSAIELSERLSGHALAISQMAGLIHKRSWSIEEFLQFYSKNTRKLHGSSLDAVWKLSFESLDPSSAALLGVMSFLMPDSIPEKLFEREDSTQLPAALKFCADDDSFYDTIGNLLTLALIKRDKTTRALSLHRLVQDQFRYTLKPAGCQTAFDAASKLLDDVFPVKPRGSHQMYNVWDICQSYLQHVLALMNNYKEHSKTPDGLKPSENFCHLLVRCSRYLCEVGGYVELAEMLDVATKAFDAWDGSKDHPVLRADILRHQSTEWLQRGDFELSDRYMKRSIELYHQSGHPDPYLLLAPYNHMANVAASANRYKDAVEWYHKAQNISNQLVEDAMKRTALTNLNLGRSLWLLGNHKEGRQKIEISVEQYLTSENWAMLVLAYFALGNMSRQEHDLELAAAHYARARDAWTANGQAPTHEIMGACLYKLGCVALDQGQNADAINYLRNAYAISGLRKDYLAGDYARTTHKLSQALRSSPEHQLEADLKATEAMLLLQKHQKKAAIQPMHPTATPFDNLVCILWR